MPKACRNRKRESVLKKSGGIICEENRLMVYRFIKANHTEFGLRWLFRRFKISPNGYYNFLKQRKFNYDAKKQAIYDEIKKVYHNCNGVIGHRNVKIFLKRRGINISKTTAHKYMNKELQLKSIVRQKKPVYQKENIHKVFPNLIKQNFTVSNINSVWCTDFTYLFLADGLKRYNCSVINLYDRSVVASLILFFHTLVLILILQRLYLLFKVFYISADKVYKPFFVLIT